MKGNRKQTAMKLTANKIGTQVMTRVVSKYPRHDPLKKARNVTGNFNCILVSRISALCMRFSPYFIPFF